jgi:hypothetical protein
MFQYEHDQVGVSAEDTSADKFREANTFLDDNKKQTNEEKDDDNGDEEEEEVEDDDDDDDEDAEVDDNKDDDDESYYPTKKPVKATTFRQVTNGIDLDTVTEHFKFIVEGNKLTEEFLDFRPSPSFLGLVFRWAGKRKFHYFLDIYNCTEVCATELGYLSPIDYIRVRAWTFSRRGTSTRQDHIEYRRLDSCLKKSLGKKRGSVQEKKGLIAKFHSMIKALYRVLKEDDKGKEAPSLLLINCHNIGSFQQRITLNTQIFHLAVSTVLYIFGNQIVPDNDVGLQELTTKIFGGCSKKFMFIRGLFDLLFYFNDDSKILSSRNFIEKLLLDPGSLLSKVHNDNMGRDNVPYLQFLELELERIFPKAGVQRLVATSLSNSAVNQAVVRKRVASLFLASQKSKLRAKKAGVPPPATGGRPTSTTSPVRKRQKVATTATPNLDSVPTLQHLLTIHQRSIPPSLTAPPKAAISVPMSQIHQATKDSLPSESYETELEKRFSTFTLADQNAIDLLGPPQVTVFSNMKTPSQCKKVLHCSPVELYAMSDLRTSEHGFNYGDGVTISSSLATLIVPSGAEHLSDGFSVLRSTSAIFKDHLLSVPLNLAPIILFTLQHGTSSALRDGTGGGKRVDCGCAGQAYSQSSDGSWAPNTSTGFNVFENISSTVEREKLLASLGCIQDGIQDCLDAIQRYLGLPLLFNYPPRVDGYAVVIRQLFHGARSRNEWLTIQVKCMSRRDETLLHFDKFNCPWEFYSTTAALCFMGFDYFQAMWSVKVIVNCRSKVGSLYSKQFPVGELLLSACTGFLLRLNEGYKGYMGSHEIKSLTWKTFENFFLDDTSPWISPVVDDGPQFLKLPTGLSRTYWMSPAIHRLLQLKDIGLSMDGLLEMVLLSSYQTSWTRHWVITGKMLELGAEPDHPSKLYCRLSIETFGSWIGGPDPRFSACGLDFSDCFFGIYSGLYLEFVIKVMRELIEWIELCAFETLTDSELQAKYSWFCSSFASVCPKCEIKEFRLQLMIELLVLTGFVRTGLHITDRAFPVVGRGSYVHLKQNQVADNDMMPTMQMLGSKIGISRQSYLENLCCEARPERKEVWDVFFKWQSLFLLLPYGVDGKLAVFRKHYGEREWVKLFPV